MVLDSSSVAREAARPLPWQNVLPVLLPSLVAAASLVSLLLLVQMSGVTATGYDLDRLQSGRADWESNNYLLEAYIADLQSLDRVEHVARNRLRMVPATQHLFLAVPVSPQDPAPGAEVPPGHVKRAAPVKAGGDAWNRPSAIGGQPSRGDTR